MHFRWPSRTPQADPSHADNTPRRFGITMLDTILIQKCVDVGHLNDGDEIRTNIETRAAQDPRAVPDTVSINTLLGTDTGIDKARPKDPAHTSKIRSPVLILRTVSRAHTLETTPASALKMLFPCRGTENAEVQMLATARGSSWYHCGYKPVCLYRDL
jgi:hypothetical protein